MTVHKCICSQTTSSLLCCRLILYGCWPKSQAVRIRRFLAALAPLYLAALSYPNVVMLENSVEICITTPWKKKYLSLFQVTDRGSSSVGVIQPHGHAFLLSEAQLQIATDRHGPRRPTVIVITGWHQFCALAQWKRETNYSNAGAARL